MIDGVVAWIECETYSVGEAGDHFVLMGLVRQLEIASGGLPLLFFQGGYGQFAPSSIMISDTRGLHTAQLRTIDQVRPEMERVVREQRGFCKQPSAG